MTASIQADIATVQMMMARFELTLTDLTTGAGTEFTRHTPTFAEFIPTTIDRMPAGRTREHYRTYWNKILTQPGWADRRLDEPAPADLQVLCEQIRAARVIRRSDRGGNEVVRHVIDALLRGAIVTHGYRGMAEKTAEALDADNPNALAPTAVPSPPTCLHRSSKLPPPLATTRNWTA